jgi:DNA-binding response OmpR family regulator
LHELRSFNNHTPAIVITAYDDIVYLQKSFDAGAHDYLRKPFELEELRLRIERSRRIFHLDESRPVRIDEKTLFYPQESRVVRGETTVRLKPKEAEILRYFLSHAGRTVSREELTTNLWEYDAMPEDSTLRSYIRNLRGYIGTERIVTERGEGWRYEPA